MPSSPIDTGAGGHEGAGGRPGTGGRAGAAGVENGGPLSGARWIARSSPDRLVRVATEIFAAEGFQARTDLAAHALTDRSGGWIAAALEIGDEKRSRRRWWTGFAGGENGTATPRGLQRGLPPTLVIVQSRAVAEGIAELVVFPYASETAEDSHARAAAPQIASALRNISDAAGAEGAMLSHESLSEPPADGDPASRAVVRDVLGWR